MRRGELILTLLVAASAATVALAGKANDVRKDAFKQKDGRYTIPWSTQLHLGFDGEASRTAAFKKARARLAEQK